jgi:cysteine desulfurase
MRTKLDNLIYLDHAATTPLNPEVLEAMMPYLTYQYANPSTLYRFGQESRAAVEAAREQVASLIGADPSEIYFTSGATESDNWAIMSTASARESKGRHIITCPIEHHAVLGPCEVLKKRGFEITLVPVDRDGLIDPEAVRSAITDQTILITIMHSNNEIGVIEPIAEIGAIARENGVLFHSDATQSVGKVPVNVDDLSVDMLSLSGHKIYGPKGIGAFYIRKGVNIPPYIHGGGQEKSKRAGTHNVPGIVGLGKAMQIAASMMADEAARETALRNRLIEGIYSRIPDVRLNGHRTRRLPNNVNMSIAGVEGESMILRLDGKGICVSSGSACTSGSLAASHVLLGIGLPHELAHGSLRLTLGMGTTDEDVDKVLEVLPGIVETLRAMSPMYEPGSCPVDFSAE